GCTATQVFTINAATSEIPRKGKHFQPKCPSDLGAISINPSGGTGPGYTASWSNGSTSYNLFGLAAGNYTVTVTDAKGCTGTEIFTVNAAPAPIAINGQVFQPNCPSDLGAI